MSRKKAVDHRGNPIQDLHKETVKEKMSNFFRRNKASNGYLMKKRAMSWTYSLIRLILVSDYHS